MNRGHKLTKSIPTKPTEWSYDFYEATPNSFLYNPEVNKRVEEGYYDHAIARIGNLGRYYNPTEAPKYCFAIKGGDETVWKNLKPNLSLDQHWGIGDLIMNYEMAKTK